MLTTLNNSNHSRLSANAGKMIEQIQNYNYKSILTAADNKIIQSDGTIISHPPPNYSANASKLLAKKEAKHMLSTAAHKKTRNKKALLNDIERYINIYILLLYILARCKHNGYTGIFRI